MLIVAPVVFCAQIAVGQDEGEKVETLSTADLLALAEKVKAPSGWQWGEPTTVRFDDKLDVKDWTFTNAKVQQNRDHWLISADERFYVHRALPKGLEKAPAVRIDTWLRATRPDDNPIRIGLGTTDANGRMNAIQHFLYDFAMNRDGETQQVIFTRDHVFEHAKMPWGKIVHVSVVISGKQVIGRRDDGKPVSAVGVREAQLDANTHFALQGWMKRVEWLAISFRKLERGRKDVNDNEQSRKAQQELTAALIRQVVPRLGADSFAARQEATQLLEQLGGAAQPAVNRALKGTEAPEVRMRLSRLSYQSDETVPVDLLPTPDLHETPDDYPPATQPEKAGQGDNLK
jgi:hypothetical protein